MAIKFDLIYNNELFQTIKFYSHCYEVSVSQMTTNIFRLS